jgi:hypothetical protein
MNTQADSSLWQLGIGAEAGTRYFEVRGNYYIPLGDGQRVDRFDFTALEPHMSGGQLTSITARTRTIDVLEEPMEGWDAELAVLVPGIDKWCDVRLIGGYFDFEGGDGGALFSSADLSGWKAGIEVRPVPAVVLSATWYENIDFVDDHWMFGLRLEIPLGKPGSFTPRRRHLQERLVEPVRRQNASINVGVNTKQVGPTKVTEINSNAELTSFVSQASNSGGSSGNVVVVTTGSGGSQGSSSDPAGGLLGSITTTGGVLIISNNGGGGGNSGGGGTALVVGPPGIYVPGTALASGWSASLFTLSVSGTFTGPLTFASSVPFKSLILGRDVIIGGNAVPAGTYPVTNGTIDVGGNIISLPDALMTP